MCDCCDMKVQVRQIVPISATDRVSVLASKQQDFEDQVDALAKSLIDRVDNLESNQKNLTQYSRKELIDRLDTLRKIVENRIEELEKRAILKPDYTPEEVSFNVIPGPNTFEWALIQMKKGKKISREGSEDTYYFTQYGSLMHIHEERGEIMLDSMEINQDELLAIDWKIV